VSAIDDLAATVRAGLDADLRIAVTARQLVGREWDLHLNERGDGAIMHEGNIIAWVDTHPSVDDLMRGILHREVAEHVVRHDPERVFAEIRAKRALVEQLLLEKHRLWESCAAKDHSDNPLYSEMPCTCGRDARVTAYLTLLAQPYQETT
jgi:hypothetical protein